MKAMINKLLLLVLLFASPLFAETLALQSFESQATDTWSYTANPTQNSKRIWWGPTTEAMGGAAAYNGTSYWAGWDLDNIESTLTFQTLSLPIGYTYSVSFYYYTKNLATTNDYCRYSVMYDNGNTWDNYVTVNNNSVAWTAVSVAVPGGSNYLRLRLSSKFDGSTKYAHWDYVVVERTPTPPVPPVVSNVTFSQCTDGSGLVDIYYDLYDANGDNSTVGLLLSTDAGASFAITPMLDYLSGDIGANIANGTAKHIIWNADAEAGDYDNNNYRLRVTADDGTNPMPANFVFVEGGIFNNGTSNVTVSSFYMDKYEMTQAGYQAVMGTNPSHYYGIGSNYPVYDVSWFNAIEYCNRRSMEEGLTPCYSYSSYSTNPGTWPVGWNTSDGNHTNVSCNWTANGYRLPTEAEWEFSARGGNQTHNYTYSGSNNLNDVGWYGDNNTISTHTIGALASNELCLFDMSGNVFELNWDIYGNYPSGAQTNPTGANSGPTRVLRGGSWNCNANYCTVFIRENFYATDGGTVGFRVVRVSP